MVKIQKFQDQRLFNASGEPISVCIIVPTYNEAGNIRDLLDRIYDKIHTRQYSENNVLMNVLVVDDNSPDGTAGIVEGYRKKNSRVHLLLRQQKNGLGAAYIAGMQHARAFLRPDIIFEMDADLSHDPSYIIPMIREASNGADFVIGSRYTKGGSIPEDWGRMRKLISKAANAYARTVLGIYKIKDCTGGFRAMKSSILDKIDLDGLAVKGYAFQISLLEAIRRNDGVVKEIPIAFKDRTNGKSKMRIADMVEVGTLVLRIAAQRMAAPINRLPSEETAHDDEQAADNTTRI